MRRGAWAAAGLLLASGPAAAQPVGFPAGADPATQRAWIASHLAGDGELIGLKDEVASFIPRDPRVISGQILVTVTEIPLTRAAALRLGAVKIESHGIIDCGSRTIRFSGDARFSSDTDMVLDVPRHSTPDQSIAGGWAEAVAARLCPRR